ncbi:MAG: hypothetical protein ABJE47_07275 [bacterium]
MNRRELLSGTPVRLSIAALVASAALLAIALVHAVRGIPATDTAPVLFDASGLVIATEPRPSPDIGVAVANDLFSPDRAEPEVAYRMPDDEVPVVRAVTTETPPPLVLGTAMMGEGHSFATCQLGDKHPVIVRVGDHLGEFIVKSIERGRVAFTNASGKRFEITALTTGTSGT